MRPEPRRAAAARIPAGRVVSRELRPSTGFRGLQRHGLTGAAIWHDYVTPESDRLTFTWALAAAEHGAVLANYVEAIAPAPRRPPRRRRSRGEPRWTGARSRSARASPSTPREVRVDRLLSRSEASTGMPLLKAMNLVTRRDGGEAALGGRSASGRHLFLVPWRGRAIFGTWESARPCTAERGDPDEHRDCRLHRRANQAFPALDLDKDDVTLVHRGAVPAVVRQRPHRAAGPRTGSRPRGGKASMGS